MKIAILGSGGREHALAVQISKSKKLDKIYCIPGNAGTNFIGKNINLNLGIILISTEQTLTVLRAKRNTVCVYINLS